MTYGYELADAANYQVYSTDGNHIIQYINKCGDFIEYFQVYNNSNKTGKLQLYYDQYELGSWDLSPKCGTKITPVTITDNCLGLINVNIPHMKLYFKIPLEIDIHIKAYFIFCFANDKFGVNKLKTLTFYTTFGIPFKYENNTIYKI